MGLEARNVKKMPPEEIRENLAYYYCTEQYWRTIPLKGAPVMTDGVKAMAEMCEAFWLVDAIVSWQTEDKVRNAPFQVWILCINDDYSARLVCEDGNHNVICSQDIAQTDFPLKEGITVYVDLTMIENALTKVLLLPSEY